MKHRDMASLSLDMMAVAYFPTTRFTRFESAGLGMLSCKRRLTLAVRHSKDSPKLYDVNETSTMAALHWAAEHNKLRQ